MSESKEKPKPNDYVFCPEREQKMRVLWQQILQNVDLEKVKRTPYRGYLGEDAFKEILQMPSTVRSQFFATLRSNALDLRSLKRTMEDVSALIRIQWADSRAEQEGKGPKLDTETLDILRSTWEKAVSLTNPEDKMTVHQMGWVHKEDLWHVIRFAPATRNGFFRQLTKNMKNKGLESHESVDVLLRGFETVLNYALDQQAQELQATIVHTLAQDTPAQDTAEEMGVRTPERVRHDFEAVWQRLSLIADARGIENPFKEKKWENVLSMMVPRVFNAMIAEAETLFNCPDATLALHSLQERFREYRAMKKTPEITGRVA